MSANQSKDLKTALKEQYGDHIDDKDLGDAANNLLGFVSLLVQIDKEQRQAKKH